MLTRSMLGRARVQESEESVSPKSRSLSSMVGDQAVCMYVQYVGQQIRDGPAISMHASLAGDLSWPGQKTMETASAGCDVWMSVAIFLATHRPGSSTRAMPLHPVFVEEKE